MRIINEYSLSNENPLSHIFAYKGGGKGSSKQSQAEKDAEAAQAKELADLEAKEEARVEAMSRKRRGRGSLISGDETGDTGLKKTLGA